MAEVQELSRLLRELDEQMVSCMKCGMCQAVCPLYAETGREVDVARGKIALVENLAGEILNDPEGVKERLDRCLLCGSCAAACPSGVRVLDIFLKARAIITGYLGLSPVKKLVFRGMLSNPGLFNSLLSVAAKLQTPFTKTVSDTLGSSCARFMSPLLQDRHFIPLAKTPWRKEVGHVDTRSTGQSMTVAVYPGCLVDKIFPRIGNSLLDILQQAQVGVFMPQSLACCGIPALSSGDRQTFEKLVRTTLNRLSGQSFDYLITPCATCTSTIKKVWPTMAEYFSGPERNAIHVLADKTLDATEFLVDKLGMGSGESPTDSGPRITYHDPCHLQKSLNVSRQPRALVKAHPGFTFQEMNESDRCCGMGGSFNLQHYDLSKRIGDRKLSNILASQAATVTTGCPACMLQISELLSKAGAEVSVRHVLEIYAEALGHQVVSEQSAMTEDRSSRQEQTA
jgi:glycolate oxidase iron-sulfur subunit